MDNKQMIQRIKLAKALGYVKTYAEFAGAVGLSVRTIYNYIDGQRAISHANKYKIDTVLKEWGL